MKTIKFRIYDKQQNKMIESGATPTMLESFFEHTAVLHTKDEMPYQQFTGLLDKQGKDIYEGDILKSSYTDFGHEVVFSHGSFVIKHNNRCCPPYKTSLTEADGWQEIIGNIFENENLINQP